MGSIGAWVLANSVLSSVEGEGGGRRCTLELVLECTGEQGQHGFGSVGHCCDAREEFGGKSISQATDGLKEDAFGLPDPSWAGTRGESSSPKQNSMVI